MANNSSLSKRAALRQQQEMDERNKRNKRILTIGAIIAAVTVIAVIAIVVVQTMSRGIGRTDDQLTPPNATANSGILVDGKAPEEGKPHLIIYEDFQCPACAAREAEYGPVVDQLVSNGDITAEFRFAHFLDGQDADGAVRHGGGSHRAAMAAAAADQVGKFKEFHQTAYANQTSSGGFSDSALRGNLAEQAGITGEALDEYTRLINTEAFWDFTVASQKTFDDNQIGSTPSYLVSGEKLEFFDQAANQVLIPATPEGMLQAITQAFEAGGGKHE